MKTFRHGDVYLSQFPTDVSIEPGKRIPPVARGTVLAYGEVTGHAHTLDHTKVEFYEKEADHAGLRLKKMIYESDMDLSRKHHLRYFADALESLSDIAEEVSDHLLIASIKRSA